jgi:hypothetical protein
MINPWRSTIPLELVRYAGANHLCIELTYDDHKKRLVEPYSLYKTKDGNLVLRVVKHESDISRSYRVDRIEGIRVTQIPFVARYEISLTPFSATVLKKPGSFHRSVITAKNKRRSANNYYTVKCGVCGKSFRRKLTQSARLNPHKNKSGLPCYGRVGVRVH